MRRHLILFAALTVLLSCQQSAPLADYAPTSDQEQALKSVLLEFQEAVRNRDAGKVEDLIHPNASIMIGNDRRLLSKAEYAMVLPGRLAENASISLKTPKMKITGNSAEVRIYMSRGGGEFLMVFNMILDNGKWFILSWEY